MNTHEGSVSISIKETSYLIIVACIALSINFFAIPAEQQSYWILWTALLLSALCLQQNFKFNTYHVLITGIISALLVWLQTNYFTVLPYLLIFLGIITLFAIFFSQQYSEWYISALIINISVLLSALFPAGSEKIHLGLYSVSANSARAIYILEGTLIAWIPQLFFWKNFFIGTHKIVRNEFCAAIVATLNLMSGFNKTIFACFLAPEYQENVYLFERRIHVQKNRIIDALVQVRQLSKLNSIANNTAFMRAINLLNLLFDLMLDYAQLRRRVTDNTIFAVCFTELTAIRDEIDELLADMIATFPKTKYHLSTQGLLEKVTSLEEVYHNVLQVTSREPLVFLLFIASLKNFCHELTIFYETLLAIRGKD